MKEKIKVTSLVKIITFNFAAAIALWPFILVRPGVKLDKRLINHEKTHLRQQEELLIIFFYLWYLFEYTVHLIKYRDHYSAYMNISFEKEAHDNERNEDYLSYRKKFNFLNYL